MTIVDGDKLREVLDWRDSKPSGDDYDGEFYDRLRTLLPTDGGPVQAAITYIPGGEEVTTIYQEALFESPCSEEPIKGTVMDIAGPPHDGEMQPEIQEKFDMMKELGYTDVHPRLRIVTIGEWEL